MTSIRPKVPRRARSLTGLVVALAILAVAVLAATAAVQLHMNRGVTVLGDPGVVARWLRHRTWADQAVFAIGIAAVVVGGLLVLAAVLPGRIRLVELTEPDDATTSGVTRGGLNRALAAVAGSVDGVDSASARVGRRRVRVHARSSLRDRSGLREGIETSVRAQLAQLDLTRRVRASVRGKGQ